MYGESYSLGAATKAMFNLLLIELFFGTRFSKNVFKIGSPQPPKELQSVGLIRMLASSSQNADASESIERYTVFFFAPPSSPTKNGPPFRCGKRWGRLPFVVR